MNSVEYYIAQFPVEIQEILLKIRTLILSQSSEITESISYGMPSYKAFDKPLVYFGAFTKHIGLYATPSGHKHFSEALAVYKQGKGSVQFPLSEAIPYDLISEIVAFRLEENRKDFSK